MSPRSHTARWGLCQGRSFAACRPLPHRYAGTHVHWHTGAVRGDLRQGSPLALCQGRPLGVPHLYVSNSW